jgi:hypothetical protein
MMLCRFWMAVLAPSTCSLSPRAGSTACLARIIHNVGRIANPSSQRSIDRSSFA